MAVVKVVATFTKLPCMVLGKIMFILASVVAKPHKRYLFVVSRFNASKTLHGRLFMRMPVNIGNFLA